jgi:hypothetical protein
VRLVKKAESRDKVVSLSILLLLVSLWIFSHPYQGFLHDARLYALQALSHIQPDGLGKDVFLGRDSQEKYTVFSKVHSRLSGALGFSNASILLLVIGQALWLHSLYLFSGVFSRRRMRVLSIAFAIAMPSYYGVNSIFSFGEPFLTPRLFSESFVMYGLSFGVRRSWLPCLFAFFLSSVTHPIVAITGAVPLVIYHAFKHKTVVIIGLALFGVSVALALMGVPPVDRLFRFMDSGWSVAVHRYNGYLFMSEASIRDYVVLFAATASLSTYCALVKGQRQRIGLSILIAFGATWIISLCLGDLARNVLIMQIQTWRSSWLLLLLSYITFGSVWTKLRKEAGFRTYFGITVCVSWLCPSFSNFPVLYLVLLAGAIACLFIEWNALEEMATDDAVGCSNRCKLLARKTYTFLSIVSPALFVLDLVVTQYVIYTAPSVMHTVVSLFSNPVPSHWRYVSVILSVTCFFVLFLARRIDRMVLIGVSVLSLCVSLFFWDERSDYQRALNTTIGREPALAQVIPAYAELLWPEMPESTWFLINRRLYASRLQASGMVFSRDTALLLSERMQKAAGLKELENPIKFYSNKTSTGEIEQEFRASIAEVCRRCSDLDFIVASQIIQEYSPALVYSAENSSMDYGFLSLYGKNIRWYLYDCGVVRLR